VETGPVEQVLLAPRHSATRELVMAATAGLPAAMLAEAAR